MQLQIKNITKSYGKKPRAVGLHRDARTRHIRTARSERLGQVDADEHSHRRSARRQDGNSSAETRKVFLIVIS